MSTGDRRKSFRETVLVVWPLAVSQLVYAANHIWDRFWLARSGSEQLQASLSATMVAMMFVAFFSSVVGYSSTFIAQLHGDGRERESVSAFAQGLWMSFFSLPFMIACVFVAFVIIDCSGHAAGVSSEEFAYIMIYVPGGVFLVLNGVLGGLLTGQGRTRFVSVCNMLGLFVNMALNPFFIKTLGLGNAGAALAGVAALATTTAALAFAVRRDPLYLRYAGSGALRLNGSLFLRILKAGLSNGLTTFISCLSFTLFTLIIGGRVDMEASASNTVFAVNTILYGLLCAISDGVAIIAGRHQGLRDADGARRALVCGIMIALMAFLICFTIILPCSDSIMRLFYPSGAAYSLADFQRLGFVLLGVMFFREIGECLAVVYEGALRGVGDVRFVMSTRFVCSLLVWTPVFIVLNANDFSIVALWTSMVGFYAVQIIAFVIRWHFSRWESKRLI